MIFIFNLNSIHMSVFDTDLVEQDYYVESFYDVSVQNAAYDSLNENLAKIFGSRVTLYIYPTHYVTNFFNRMPLTEFEKLIERLENQEHKYRWKQFKLHKFLIRQLKVKTFYAKEAQFEQNRWGGDYSIFIPNGQAIEFAVADGIKIVFKKKK